MVVSQKMEDSRVVRYYLVVTLINWRSVLSIIN